MTDRYPTKAEIQERAQGLEQELEALRASLAEAEGRLGEAETKRDEYLEDLRRVAADFDNYRKRAAREHESLVARAHERLVRELLPVLDDLERALEAAGEPGASNESSASNPSATPAKLDEGVRLVERELRQALSREGLVEIETDRGFDPHLHEALLTQPSEADEGDIVQVLQKGYRLGDKVIRPARVVISAGLQEARAEE